MTLRPSRLSAAVGDEQLLQVEAFQPHALLRGFHRMTLASMFIRPNRSNPVPAFVEQVFDVDDGTKVLGLCSWQQGAAPVVVIVHGLAGHADRPYMRGAVRKAYAAGFHVVRLNMRNCGDTEHLAGSMYHAGLVDDLEAVVRALVLDERCRRIHMTGFSMGGNIALRLGGLWGDDAPADVASIVAVSPVLDLNHCAGNLDSLPALRIYRDSFLKRLRATFLRRAELFPDRYDPRLIKGVNTLRGFDALATAPDCGYTSVDEYYDQASCRLALPSLKIPSLVLHSEDDLLVNLAPDQQEILEACPAIQLVMSSHGGHCGFVASRALRETGDRYWAEHCLVDYVCWAEAQPRQAL